MLVLSACTAIGVVRLGRLRQAKSPIECKTNALHKAVTTRGDALANLADAAGLYFIGKYRSTWKQGAQPTRIDRNAQKVLFSYPLKIEHIVDMDPAVQTNHTRPTLYLHGWADTGRSALLLKALCDVLPGDVITFDFRDRGVVIPKLRHSNLGQLPDVLPALYTLKWAKDTLNLDEIDLFGYSRGAAVVLNMLAVLNDKTGKYDNDLARLQIYAKERSELLAMIQRGCITLNCPLTNANVSANFRFKEFAPNVLKLFSKVARYKIDGIQAIESAEQLAGLKLNILMHFQYHDTIVSNANEAELYARLAKHNPETTYVVLGNNGGHIHTHAALAHSIHTFKKQFGSSYDPEYDEQYHATRALLHDSSVLLQPGEQASTIIAQYYDECQQNQREISEKKSRS